MWVIKTSVNTQCIFGMNIINDINALLLDKSRGALNISLK